MPYSVIFFGTSDFSTPSLQALINDARFSVKTVVTKPDMKVGRHQEEIEPPVKKMSKKHAIPVLQFDKIKTEETYNLLKDAGRGVVVPAQVATGVVSETTPRGTSDDDKIDVYVVVSYGKIIPQRILELPKYGVINVHGSLLPKHRGASCVQSAIASGDKETGVTIMLMDAEMDHGPILAQKTTPIREDDTGGILHDRLADIGAVLLPDVLMDFIEHKIEPMEQKHDSATYCKILKREDGEIDWSKSAAEIERLVRAYNPWPGTFVMLNGKRIKIHKSSSNVERLMSNEASTWFSEDDRLFVTCGDKQALEILELQPEGKRRMSAKEFLAGHQLDT
ncbi:MAG: methionyl-tRNA formyltransferase [Patescibacteria group bacterium]